ncbi:hypothetical protein [Protaetiibacter mangrovi]|uniref:Uncharacterized protein n=1 Tax=Protaetiibacter mangrovi TaxID=2970926 RepID=A0ABT1ZCX1_9MICO|nr:hypothetical protein [Protaetiibacter mangrovi]MCS0498551.1 hypothetical protein [Protaetiibacter mangrovi]TPW93048.1 hypothetical protein FJ656_35055 [Schumannella luteola]
MSDRDDVKQPTDHLPPGDDASAVTPPADHPQDAAEGGSAVGPETAAEPEKPARHGVAKMPPGVG